MNNQTIAKKGIDKKQTFSRLTPNLPLVLCGRINLYHLLQVHFIGCARAQGQGDGGFPRGRSRVQQSTGSRGVWIPLAIISFPLPHCTQNIGSTLNHVLHVSLKDNESELSSVNETMVGVGTKTDYISYTGEYAFFYD